MKKLLLIALCINMLLLTACQPKTIPIDYVIDRVGCFDKMDMAPFQSDGKWGYLKIGEGVVLDPAYDNITPYFMGHSIIHNGLDSQIIDRTGAFLLDDWVNAYIKLDPASGEYYYFDNSEKITLPVPKIEEAEPTQQGSPNRWTSKYEYNFDDDGVNLLHQDTGKLLFDKSHQLLREVISREIVDDDKYYFILRNDEKMGIAEVREDNVHILAYDTFEKVSFYEMQGCMIFEQGNTKWLYNINGDLLLESNDTIQFNGRSFDGRIAFKQEGKWGFIDSKSGKVVVEAIYYKASDFDNSYALVQKSKDSNQLQIIDIKGNVLIESKGN